MYNAGRDTFPGLAIGQARVSGVIVYRTLALVPRRAKKQSTFPDGVNASSLTEDRESKAAYDAKGDG